MDDQVLHDALGADAGLERGIFGRRGRGLADIGRGQDELVEGDVADFGCGGHGWVLRDGRAEPFSRPGKPVTNPLSALFLSGAGGGSCGREQGRGRCRGRHAASGVCGGFRRGVAVAEGEQIVGRLGGGAGRADDRAVVLAQHLEPGAEIIGVAHRRHDRQRRADEGAGHFGDQFFLARRSDEPKPPERSRFSRDGGRSNGPAHGKTVRCKLIGSKYAAGGGTWM